MTKDEAIAKAQALFDEGYACSQSIVLTFANRFNLNEETAKLISSVFGGGMGRLREKCGAVTGSFMILGLAYGNASPNDMKRKLEAYANVREMNTKFIEIHGTASCAELLKKHSSREDIDKRTHHKLICREVVGDAAGILFDLLDRVNK